MKKNIVILGSTGSIGQSTFNIIKKDKKNFDIKLLSTNKNVPEIIRQAKEFKVKNIIINDYDEFIKAKFKNKYKNITIFNKFKDIDKILNKKKIFYSMVAVSGLEGLQPTLMLPKYSKYLAIANKESLICGWSLIQKELKKYNTNFLPIDSEHYSIFSLIKHVRKIDIKKIYITASGGPFLNYPIKKFKFIKPAQALKHPNWKMGKKITIDSATLMNKVFEVIEAKNIFNISYNKIAILTHPSSYVHALVMFKSGITKLLIHEPDMKIPIYNSIYKSNNNLFKKNINTKSLDFKIINNLDLKDVNVKKFPSIKLLKKLPERNSLFETVLITINDYLVYKFLDNKISFEELNNMLIKLTLSKEFSKYKKIIPKNLKQINDLRKLVSLKMSQKVI
jgi:1-deoxy-D-xylulose-5-phosphate reductoisomerase